MEHLVPPILPIFLLVICMIGLALGMLIAARIVRPGHPGRVTRMPYESGMDPIHDTRRRFDVRFYLLAIAFLVFDVELLFLYPWAVAFGGLETPSAVSVGSRHEAAQTTKLGDRETASLRPSPPLLQASSKNSGDSATAGRRHIIFAGMMVFVVLLTLGYVYDWRKGVFQWR
jgi:NADH-quinone oxidoreductase subunit A